MKNDRLREATAYFVETSAAWPASVVATRARIVASARREGARTRGRAVLLPGLALLVASTAWGTIARRWPRLFRGLSSTATSPVPAPARRAPPATRAPEIVALPSVIAVTPEAPRAARPLARAKPRISEAPPPVVDDLALYGIAHRLHFQDRRPDAALEAWDAYLRSTTTGSFVVEARYNRALCLVRLGRTEEALRALAPFAAGDHGSYRRDEARDLIEVLRP